MLLLLLRPREEDIIDSYVDFRNPQSHQVLDSPYNVAAHRFGDLRYGPAVLYGQREVDGGLLFADLHRDAAGGARPSSHAVEDSTDGAGGATAHLYPFDLRKGARRVVKRVRESSAVREVENNMKHEEFAERAAKRLLDMADRLEEEGRRLGVNGKVSARAKEMRVAAFMVRGEAEAITRAENEPSAEPR